MTARPASLFNDKAATCLSRTSRGRCFVSASAGFASPLNLNNRKCPPCRPSCAHSCSKARFLTRPIPALLQIPTAAAESVCKLSVMLRQRSGALDDPTQFCFGMAYRQSLLRRAPMVDEVQAAHCCAPRGAPPNASRRLSFIQRSLVAVSKPIFLLLILHSRCAEPTHVLLQFADHNLLVTRVCLKLDSISFQDRTQSSPHVLFVGPDTTNGFDKEALLHLTESRLQVCFHASKYEVVSPEQLVETSAQTCTQSRDTHLWRERHIQVSFGTCLQVRLPSVYHQDCATTIA